MHEGVSQDPGRWARPPGREACSCFWLGRPGQASPTRNYLGTSPTLLSPGQRGEGGGSTMARLGGGPAHVKTETEATAKEAWGLLSPGLTVGRRCCL